MDYGNIQVGIHIPKRDGFKGYGVSALRDPKTNLGEYLKAGTHYRTVTRAQLAELEKDPIISIIRTTDRAVPNQANILWPEEAVLVNAFRQTNEGRRREGKPPFGAKEFLADLAVSAVKGAVAANRAATVTAAAAEQAERAERAAGFTMRSAPGQQANTPASLDEEDDSGLPEHLRPVIAPSLSGATPAGLSAGDGIGEQPFEDDTPVAGPESFIEAEATEAAASVTGPLSGATLSPQAVTPSASIAPATEPVKAHGEGEKKDKKKDRK